MRIATRLKIHKIIVQWTVWHSLHFVPYDCSYCSSGRDIATSTREEEDDNDAWDAEEEGWRRKTAKKKKRKRSQRILYSAVSVCMYESSYQKRGLMIIIIVSRSSFTPLFDIHEILSKIEGKKNHVQHLDGYFTRYKRVTICVSFYWPSKGNKG